MVPPRQGYIVHMTTPTPDPTRIPAVTGVQPDAPNAKDADAHDLAEGPPSTEDDVVVESTDED
jgi:hypothetical protein